MEAEKLRLIASVDETTRARIGALSARRLSSLQIKDILMLTFEQVEACKESEEFKIKYAAEADQLIQDQIDRDEGWDALETAGLEILLQTVKFNRDPKFALFAAKTANAAERRSRNKTNAPHVIDNSKGGSTNIIMLTVNKIYAEGRQNKEIDITPRPKEIPRQQFDLPPPKLVNEMLGGADAEKNKKKTPQDDLKQMFNEAGVVFDDGD